eukprot:g30827.t1
MITISLNVGKTEELISDFRKKRGHAPVYINGAEVDRVENVKFLGVTITINLLWTSCLDATAKKAQQCCFFLRQKMQNLNTCTNRFKNRFFPAVADVVNCMEAAGCVIAELFTEGVPMFDLSQLLAYRNGHFSHEQVLNKIEDLNIRGL